MGGRSGQSSKTRPSSAVGTVTSEGKISQKLKDELLAFAQEEMKFQGITENIKIKFVNKPRANFAGQVRLIPGQTKVTELEINIGARKIKEGDAKDTIAHELTHVRQINKGDLFISGTHFYWKKQQYMSRSQYNTIISRAPYSEAGLKIYKKLPWEAEAYARGELYSVKK